MNEVTEDDLKQRRMPKTPQGRYLAAQIALDRWLTRLCRAAKEVQKIRKTLRYYERSPMPRRERRYRTGAKQPKSNLWIYPEDKGEDKDP